jgi:hypothetical protein
MPDEDMGNFTETQTQSKERTSRAVMKQSSLRKSKIATKVVDSDGGSMLSKIRGIIVVLLDAAFFQSFLDLHEHDDDPTGLRSGLADGNASLAVVNALLLSMIFPMGMTPDDWLKEGREGWVAQTFGISWLFDEEYAGYWYDQSIVGFRIGLGALLMAVVATIFQMLAINEIQDDNHAQVYVKTVHKAALKFPFRSMIVGLIAPFGFSVGIRHFFTSQTPFAICGMILTLGPIGLAFVLSIYSYMKAVFTAVEEKGKFEHITVSEADIKVLAEEYFELKPDTFDMADFLGTLSDITERGYAVPIAYCTRMLARKHFYLNAGKKLGLELPPDMLAKLCFERAQE